MVVAEQRLAALVEMTLGGDHRRQASLVLGDEGQ